MSRSRTRRRAPVRALLVVLSAAFLALASLAGPALADPGPTDPVPTDPSVPSTLVDPGTSTAGSTLPGGVTTSTEPRPKVTSGPGGFGAPKPDPDAPPEPPMPDPSPQVRVLLAQLRVQSQQKRMDVQVDKLHRIEQSQRAAGGRVHAAQREVERAVGLVHASERRLRDDAVATYINPGQTGLEDLVDTGSSDQRTRSIILSATIDQELDVRLKALALVASKRRFLAGRVSQLHSAEATTARQRTVVAASTQSRDAKQQQLDVSLQFSPDWSLPIQGDSVFKAPELADWFFQHGVSSRAQESVHSLAKAYIDEGRDEHVRGDMAFAQSVLETGSFTNDDTVRFNNFAGVGHCDSCKTGFAFPTPLLGVRAQIQLLRDYSERGARLSHPLVDSRLRGPSGCCQDWRQLTHTWATNGNYGAKIMNVYLEMLSWLVQERGMTPLVGR